VVEPVEEVYVKKELGVRPTGTGTGTGLTGTGGTKGTGIPVGVLGPVFLRNREFKLEAMELRDTEAGDAETREGPVNWSRGGDRRVGVDRS